MSFFQDPVGNISGALHKIDKSPIGKALEGAALMAFAPEMMGGVGGLFGGGAALGAGLTVGGIAGLSSGNLAQGLMAGLSAYGGASMVGPTTPISANPAPVEDAASRMTQVGSQAPVTPGATITPTNVSQFTVPSSISETELGQAGLNRTYSAIPETTTTPMPRDFDFPQSPTAPNAPSGIQNLAKSAADKTSLYQDLKDKFMGLSTPAQVAVGLGGLGLLREGMKPQPLNAPKQANTQNYRYYNYSPFGGYSGQGVTPVTGARGGIVALADGGMPGYETVGNDGNAAPNPASGPAGQLAFNNEPVMRMAKGGIAHFDGSDGSVVGYYEDGSPQYASAPAASAAPEPSAAPFSAPASTGFTNQQIQDAVRNIQAQGGGDKEIAAAMDQNHVGIGQLAGALGMNVGDVQSRYNAATPTGNYYTGTSGISNQDIRNALSGQYAGASDYTLANAMDKNHITPQQMAYATGVPLAGEGNIVDRYALVQALTQATGQGGSLYGEAAGRTPNALDPQAVAWMDNHLDASGKPDPISIGEIARITGMSEDDVRYRYNLAKNAKTDTKIDTKTLGTGLTGLPATTTTTVLPTNPQTNAPAGTTNPYGNINNPGDITFNPDGSKTITPNIPGRPYGGFSGMDEVKNAYTAGGGSLGYTNPAPKTMDEFNTRFNTQTGGTKAAYDYLMGKSPYPTVPYTPTGEIAKPYQSSVMGMPLSPKYTISQPLIFNPTTKTYVANPAYDPNFSATKDYIQAPQTGLKKETLDFFKAAGLPDPTVDTQTLTKALTNSNAADTSSTFGAPADFDSEAYLKAHPDVAAEVASGKLASAYQHYLLYGDQGTKVKDPNFTYIKKAAQGGLMALAAGGMSGMSIGHLGGYSDGGRLLRGPGDGVSDSIPATIGSHDPEPARLADGEFVVPARIVSELGNGSTEAGARQLYKMMDRIQHARRKTIGKERVATNTHAAKYLPA